MITWNIGNHIVEFYEDEHRYLVDGLILPSITQILKTKFGDKYDGIPEEVLKRAADKGTKVHEAIENYCKTGEVEDLKEVKNFIFLQKKYDFKVIENEVPIFLFKDDVPIACGRLDLTLSINDEVGGADIKRTSVLDKEYLAYQLNLYRIGYMQTYGIEWKFLKGIHLRDDIRKFINIPINEQMAWDLVNEYLGGKDGKGS